ncbi:MAG: ThuA domain-containing protein [Planctomycetaceae bacterium]|jgi:type 1 glutamine amidotransferase|nr:ThuA domain-containing protein [Planctomycetaceae bacterium]
MVSRGHFMPIREHSRILRKNRQHLQITFQTIFLGVSMRSVFRTFFLLLLYFSVPLYAQSPENETKKLLVAVMVSDDHYDADKLLPPMMQRLGKENGWDVVILHGQGTANFPNIDVLDKADVLVVYIRRLALPKEQLEKVKKFVKSGRGLVGLRTACHAFVSSAKVLPEHSQNWREFDRDVLGGNYHGHGKDELGSEIENVAAQSDSPILKEVTPTRWHSVGSLYYTEPVKEDATIYQTASSSQRKNVPLTWTRMYGKTRIAFTALGHQKDFEIEAFQNLVRNLVHWAAQ